MTFADWKLDLDSEPQLEVSDDAYDLVTKSVEPLGQEYCQEVACYKKERWSTLRPMPERTLEAMLLIHRVHPMSS